MTTRDETNFHTFLATIRREKGITLRQAADGLCSKSELHRIEKGERLPEKLMRDRLLERMGVSVDYFEDYLQPDEYERLLLRQKILLCLENQKYAEMEAGLTEYEKLNLGKVEKQFLYGMRFYCLQGMQSDLAVQREMIEQAVGETILWQEGEELSDKILAIPELLLWLEYVNVQIYTDPEEKVRKLAEIIDYLNSYGRNDVSRVKLLPKASLYYCQSLDPKREKDAKTGLQVCEKAIKMLQKEMKLYYMVELLEQQDIFARQCSGMEGSDEIQARNKAWEKAIVQLYKEYGMNPYMTSDVTEFAECKSYAIGNVIRQRRTMYGLSREELCEGICSKRTLMRIELLQSGAQMPIVRKLFGKLGLNADYTRSRVVTNDSEAVCLMGILSRCMNNGQLEEGERCLDRIEEHLDMTNIHNKQVIKKCRLELEYERGLVSKKEYEIRMREILELTIPWDCAMQNGYFTEEELMCILGMSYIGEEKEQYCLLLERVCKNSFRKEQYSNESMAEILRRGVGSYLGDIGEYDRSDEIVKENIKSGLRYRRSNLMASNLYCLWWNEQQRGAEKSQHDGKTEERARAEECLVWSDVAMQEENRAFYEEKMKS